MSGCAAKVKSGAFNALGATMDSKAVLIRYTNYKGVTADRVVLPERLWFGSTSWHPTPQWLMDALDVAKGERRTFALSDVASWIPAPSVSPSA